MNEILESDGPSGFITVVSGLPRSGTSLMMQMLEAGGIEALTDRTRKADVDNPRGYLEFEPVKILKRDPSWLPEARGKAVKVISQLLFDLPTTERFRIVFMRRNLDEVIASQVLMLARAGRNAPAHDKLREALATHLRHLDDWLAQQVNMSVLTVDFGQAIADPIDAANQVNRFLSGRLDAKAMAKVVDPLLYRNRTETSS